MNARRLVVLFLIAGTFVAAAASWYLSYKAGCAGDTKGGALGDPNRALQIESMAFLPELLALFGLTVFPFAFGKGSIAIRSAVAAVLFLSGGIGLKVASVYFEVLGVRSCF